MTQLFDCTDRRILAFPAVQPCEGVSLHTLLCSLIMLSQSITGYQAKSLGSQKRNARQTIRQVVILLAFFEELREHELDLPDSVVLCLSEIHHTFQKVKFLLEDCAREGARLWMLMKSQLVVNQFRVLTRVLATVLDVLPMDLIDVGGEVKELVELVAKQARKAKLDPDPEAEWTSEQVKLILNHFKKGIEPDLGLLNRVLEYLEIRSWSDCNREVKFLEEEIRLQSSDCNEKEVPFLSSLLALMCYCRGVLFEATNYRNCEQGDTRCNMETIGNLNLEDLRCPISLELMTDPVTVSTGQTYDRSSIQKWLKAGNKICPKTGERLTNTDLIPNTSIRKLIQQFCAKNGVSLPHSKSQSQDIAKTIDAGSLTAAETIKFLSRFLAGRLVFGSSEQKAKAAHEIRLLAKSNIFNRSCLLEAGAMLPLLDLLSSLDQTTQELAIAAVLKLSKHATGKKAIMENGGLKCIVAVLDRGLTLEARQMAAATIFYLASVKGYRKFIGETPQVVPALVKLIKDGNTCGKKNAVVAIFGLLLYPGNQRRMLESGIVPLLVDILSSSVSDELKVDSLAVLAALSERANGALTILQTNALHLVPRTLQSMTSKSGKEYCVSILLALCKNGGVDAIGVLAENQSLMGSLYALVSDGTSHASSKAGSIIKIVRKFRETSSLGPVASPVPCERPVHVW